MLTNNVGWLRGTNKMEVACEVTSLRVASSKRPAQYHQSHPSAGFSLIELLLVVTVSLILCAIAVPATRSAIANYQLTAAVDSATGVIQSTRYQAIMNGYPYQVVFNATNNTFQVSNEAPPATSFTSVASAVPLSAERITLSASPTFQFKPNGSVSATVGAMSFTITYNGVTKTVTVSNYGSINVQ
jgi:prepilin-type N-terminal cleavage/methylation domain-containing protein